MDNSKFIRRTKSINANYHNNDKIAKASTKDSVASLTTGSQANLSRMNRSNSNYGK